VFNDVKLYLAFTFIENNAVNLYHPDFIPSLQAQALRYLVSQHLHLFYIQVAAQVVYPNCVTDVCLMCREG
jgi:hypothetical protein